MPFYNCIWCRIVRCIQGSAVIVSVEKMKFHFFSSIFKNSNSATALLRNCAGLLLISCAIDPVFYLCECSNDTTDYKLKFKRNMWCEITVWIMNPIIVSIYYVWWGWLWNDSIFSAIDYSLYTARWIVCLCMLYTARWIVCLWLLSIWYMIFGAHFAHLISVLINNRLHTLWRVNRCQQAHSHQQCRCWTLNSKMGER